MLAYITWEGLRQAVTLGIGAGLLYVFWRCWEWRPRNWRAGREWRRYNRWLREYRRHWREHDQS